jgi:hypothetical protein
MLEMNWSVKNCLFTNNRLPIDKICHPDPVSLFPPELPRIIKYRSISEFH